ncbi:MAG: hypothetical protein RRC07_14360 [Anaerolineae bacterium]|nr:hypothetical protein [Anaerolineae bacterium]
MNANTVSGQDVHDMGRSSRGPLLIGVLIVLALLVAGGSILWQGSRAAQTAAPLTGERFLAANPELKAAQGYAAWSGAAAGETALSADAFLARNPELKAVARFAATGDEHAFLAQNPELKAVRRYAGPQAGD